MLPHEAPQTILQQPEKLIRVILPTDESDSSWNCINFLLDYDASLEKCIALFQCQLIKGYLLACKTIVHSCHTSELHSRTSLGAFHV